MAVFTSPQLQMISAGLGFVQSYNNAKLSKINGETSQILRNIQADQLLRNATSRMNQGVREAQKQKYAGEVTESDAVAAMAASGASVDPVLLARIKQRADHNTMTSIYEASSAASDLRYQSAMARIQGSADRQAGKTKADDIMLGAYSTAMTNWPRSTAQKPDPLRYAGNNAGK